MNTMYELLKNMGICRSGSLTFDFWGWLELICEKYVFWFKCLIVSGAMQE